MSCSHCLRLSTQLESARATIRELQHDLGLRAEHGALGALMDALGVTPTEALLLAVLRAARGGYVATGMLIGSTSVPDDVNLRSHIVRLRRKIGKASVTSAWGRGYALSESGLALVNSAMRVDCT